MEIIIQRKEHIKETHTLSFGATVVGIRATTILLTPKEMLSWRHERCSMYMTQNKPLYEAQILAGADLLSYIEHLSFQIKP